jgi:hypothetical protein
LTGAVLQIRLIQVLLSNDFPFIKLELVQDEQGILRLILNQMMPYHDRKELIIMTQFHGQNFLFLIVLIILVLNVARERHLDLINKTERNLIINPNLVLERYHVNLFAINAQTTARVEAVITESHHVLMEVLPSVYIEPDLSCFVRHTISAGGSIHHLTAVHEIVHAVFNDRHQSFLIDSIEVNQSLSCDLNLGVAFDEIDETTFFNFVILFPTVAHRVVVISSSNSFEEENGVR